ncbi:patatin-like phospholipase family protein [Archangium sp.]|uniref:patatin-like phospholipase family protein n=1 Tax=Archangium sp. TaxID=1872627 RepID=UPI002D458693|nr:patatin-like phospholipase family protein [Archangium sp.]HYO53322.1 patatin-like phospholipase family protein [Archangium sp.]
MMNASASQVSNDTGQENNEVKVISFDGGPSPMVTLRILYKIEQWYADKNEGRSFIKTANMFAGTSDGALISLFMANALKKDKDLSGLKLLEQCIEFNDKLVRMFKLDDTARMRLLLGKESIFEREVLEDILKDAFEDTLMEDLVGSDWPVLVGAFDATAWEMTTFHSDNWRVDGNMKLVDVGLAASAFPIMLPPFKSPDHPQLKNHLILDGVLASNSMIPATIRGVGLRFASNPQGDSAEANRSSNASDRIKLLSIGSTSTRFPNENDKDISTLKIILFLLPYLHRLFKFNLDINNQADSTPRSPKTGWRAWFENLFSVLNAIIEGGSQLDDGVATHTLGPKRYFRFKPEVPNFRLVLLSLADPEKALLAAENCADEFFNKSNEEYENSKQGPDSTQREHAELLRWIEENWK